MEPREEEGESGKYIFQVTYLFLVASLGLFVIGFKLSGLVPKIRSVTYDMRQATAVMRSEDLSDEQKESALQSAAVRMFGAFVSITLRVAIVIAMPVLFVVGGSELGLYTLQNAISSASNGYFILGSTIVMMGALAVLR